MSSSHTLVPYQVVTDPSYAEQAAHAFTMSIYEGEFILLRGECPRCHATIAIPVFSLMFDGGRTLRGHISVGAPPNEETVEEPMICTCDGEEHPGRPPGRVGCGAYWTLLVDRDGA